MNRRDFITGLGAVVVGASCPASWARTKKGRKELRTGRTHRPGEPAQLPEWNYGHCSSAPDTMLMFRGNPAHTLYGTGPMPDTLSEQWRFRTEDFNTQLRGKPKVWSGTGWTGQASMLGNYVFFGSQDRHLYCLDATTGKMVWRYRGGRMFKGSVCVYENRLYAPNVDDRLHCLDAASGDLLWRYDTGRDLDSSPCVWNGRLYIAGESGWVRCIEPETGRGVWKTFVGGIGPGTKPGSNGAEGSPAVDRGQLVVGNYDGELHCLDALTGDMLWKANTGDDTDGSAVLTEDRIFIGAEENSPYLFCFDREKGEEVWKFGNGKGWYSTPAVVGGEVYVTGNDGLFYCLHAADGKVKWQYEMEEHSWCSPAVVDGRIIFGSYGKNLVVLDAKTGAEIQKIDVRGRVNSTPIIVKGKVFVGTAEGWFYCLG